jgi:hypothetical protein
LFEDFFKGIMLDCAEKFKHHSKINFNTVYEDVKEILLQEFPNEASEVAKLIKNEGWPGSRTYNSLGLLHICDS